MTRFLTDAVIHDKNVFLVSVPTKSLDLVESSEGILLILDFIVSKNAYFRTIAVSKSPLYFFKKEIHLKTHLEWFFSCMRSFMSYQL